MHNPAALIAEIMCMKTFAVLIYLTASTVTTPPVEQQIPAPVEEKHCGWLVNPDFRNWSLLDADRKWIISEPDGYEAEGSDKMPDLASGEYTSTSQYGSYGYACACVYGKGDYDSSQILSIKRVEMKTLGECEADINLPIPPDDANQ